LISTNLLTNNRKASSVTYKMLRSIIPILFLPLIFSRFYEESEEDEGRASAVYNCHSYQIAPLGELWRDAINVSHNESCINNNCMLFWGITTDKRVRILAQGCSKGETLHKPARDTRPMQNECPSGMNISPQRYPILLGEYGATILRSLTHIQICLCQSDWCNSPVKKDGESCEGDESPFCNPLSSDLSPAGASNYSVEAIPIIPPTISSTTEASEEWTLASEEEHGWRGNLMSFLPLLAILLIIIGAMAALIFAFMKKLCVSKPDQDGLELLGYRDSKKMHRHTSGRLNSIAQVTILTEVAQGYKQEGEELIRDCHAGGTHQIANWKLEEAVKLGAGSFGAVYKVEMKLDYLVDKKVAALKTFSHMRSTHFFNESRTLKYVQDFKRHPNIIHYLGRAVDC
ncbi:hypothetical protein PENTCL1PPCAC_18190, partial [Pristionchus entomophagus]